jgi:hypothetical protein
MKRFEPSAHHEHQPVCPLEALSAPQRRERLAPPEGLLHLQECASCRVFVALDEALVALALDTPPPPSRGQWVYARARWEAGRRKDEPRERAVACGEAVARALGAGGVVLGLYLCLRAWRDVQGAVTIPLALALIGVFAVTAVVVSMTLRTDSAP